MPNSELLLSKLRKDLSDIDEALLKLVAQRQVKVLEIGKVKQSLAYPVFDPKREQEQYQHYSRLAEQLHLDKTFVAALFDMLITQSRKLQQKITD